MPSEESPTCRLHITPILPGPNAITADVSSTDTLLNDAGCRNGVPHVLPSVPVTFKKIWFPCCHAAHTRPVESLSMVRVSTRKLLMVVELSSEYVLVLGL